MDNITVFFYGFRWQDFLDIGINSYLLFRLYVLFRGTNAFRIMLGMAGLWFFQRIAIGLGLVVTSWVIQGITAAAAIIIIVIFRNEIRSVFQARNLRNVFWGVPKRAVETPVAQLADALFELAAARTGALLVLPGREDITEIIQCGVTWQGKISKEMIQTIFHRNNPVHDGAAIIREDRVDTVGCILPLSRRRDLPSYFGTRHRAAAGLAEISDAMVIVVSEETGTISVASGNKMYAIRKRRDLEEIIAERMGEGGEKRVFYQREGFKRAAAAILSVLFVTGVWATFTRSMDTLIALEVPIRYLNRRPGMEIVEATPPTVRLQLSGAAALLRAVTPDQIQVSLNLRDAVLGKNTFSVTPEAITLPPGIQVIRITPPRVDVVVDVQVEKDVPVQADWIGRLDKDLVVTKVKIVPPDVRIAGRSQMVGNIRTLYTETIDLSTISQSGEIVKSLALDSAYTMAANKPANVRVIYTVARR